LTSTPPSLDRRIVEALVKAKLPDSRGRRLLLAHGRYADPVPDEFQMAIGDTPTLVRITDQASVLGIVEAWQEHQDSHPNDDSVLVVTTAVADRELGWDLRGYAVRGATQSVDRVEIVKYRFGASDVDPRIRRDTWLVDGLLAAEPAIGWPRSGSVLTRDAAVRALLGARLGSPDLVAGALDAGALLAWSQTTAGPARFAALDDAERAGLTAWLAEVIGPVAPVVLGLAAAGRAPDALGLGLIASVTTQPGGSVESGVAFGSLVGSALPRNGELRAFVEAVEGTIQRWIGESESGGAQGALARERVLAIVRTADQLAASVDLTDALASNRFLLSSFQRRLHALAGALSAKPDANAVRNAERALADLLDHAISRLFPERCGVAGMAVRLLRWLTTPTDAVDSVAAGIRTHAGDWGWVDRALDTLWTGDDVNDPVLTAAYRAIYAAVRLRRDALDEAFATCLVSWTEHASSQAPGGCLLVEDVLAKIARPLTGQAAPLILVLDGMSSAVAAQLGERLAGRPWTEAAPAPSRGAAASAIPSITRVSRASLLTGSFVEGGQSVEKDGFAAFWRRHRRAGVLFHKSEIAGQAGQRLAEPLVEALAGESVVGVVLNTVDDALEHDREGARTGWTVQDITFLPQLLDAALDYRRPVVLVSDHGHVLERSDSGDGPVAAAGVQSARWRTGTGTAEAGEIVLAGPRVAYGGRIVAPWREDIRYTPRKAGYHGGASLAEMTVPVLVLLPDPELLPDGWHTLPPESITPEWWSPTRRTEPATAVVVPTTERKSARRKPTAEIAGSTPLFSVDEVGSAAPVQTLGTRVVDSEVYTAQRAFVRRSPGKPEVAAVIDALVTAHGRLSLAAFATKAGRAGRNPDFLATTLQRLLNVEGYPILSIVDGGSAVRLDVELLKVQFRVAGP
jgi:PglZ domain